MNSTTPKRNGAIDYSKSTRPEFNRAANGNATKEQRRESFMVKRDQPKPAPRPAPHMANGPDRAAFNQKWRQEQKQAQAAQPKPGPQAQAKPQPHGRTENMDKMVRKAAFMARRQAPAPSKTKTRNR